MTELAALAHINPKTIGTKLDRKIQKDYGHLMIAGLNSGGPGGQAAAAGPAPGAQPEDAADEKFDASDAIAPRTWYVAKAGSDVPPPPTAILGPYRIVELKAMFADGLVSEETLVAAGFTDSYVDEDGTPLQVGGKHPWVDASLLLFVVF